jgi:hypothetical protein
MNGAMTTWSLLVAFPPATILRVRLTAKHLRIVSRFQAISTNYSEYREGFAAVDAAAKEFKSREKVRAENGGLKDLRSQVSSGLRDEHICKDTAMSGQF